MGATTEPTGLSAGTICKHARANTRLATATDSVLAHVGAMYPRARE